MPETMTLEVQIELEPHLEWALGPDSNETVAEWAVAGIRKVLNESAAGRVKTVAFNVTTKETAS